MINQEETRSIKLTTGGEAMIRAYLTARDRIAIASRNNEDSINYAIKELLISFDGKTGEDALNSFLDCRSADDFDAVITEITKLALGGGDSAKK